MDTETLRSLFKWHPDYHREWDESPDAYLENGVVQWGRSRRVGMFRVGAVKAYLGVQHVDPTEADWGSVREPHARFFLSLFLGGKVVTLRTYRTTEAALDALCGFLLAGTLR